MSLRQLGTGMAVAAALATAACGGVSNNNSADAGTIAPTFTSIQQNIFNVSCAVSPCHTTATYTSAGYLDLSQGNAYASLLGDAGTGAPIPAAAVMNTSNDPGEGVAADGGYLLVAPGDPAKSFLLLKITPGLQPQYGLQMPNTGVTLSTDQVQAVSQWIQNGAMND